MIKIERKHECKSFFRKEALLDLSRYTEYKVSFFGLTIFKRDDKFRNDFREDDNNGVGFKK